MFPRSLQWRLVTFFCLIIFCLVIPIGLYLNSRIESKYYDDFRKRIERGFEEWSVSNGPHSAQELKTALENSKDVFLLNLENRSYTIVDKNGEIFYTNDRELMSNPRELAMKSLLASDNFVQALTGTENNKKILETSSGMSFYDYARPVGGYVIYFRYYKEDWADITRHFNNIIYSSLLIGFAIAFAAGYFFSRAITYPLAKLMRKAESIAKGDFDQELEVKSGDEIGKLADTFNYMAANLKNTLVEISSEKSKLETILNYMTDGIIAFNLRGEVIHTNPASARILGAEGLMTFQEYRDRFGFEYSFEDVLYLQSKQTTEMNLAVGEKTVKVYFAVFTDESKKPEGVIAVLQDITEQQRLENMRKEFVANVSHELRTPLTSIKSYSETLLDGALEDRETAEHFLTVINSEADRMTRIIRDLLQLSSLDYQQTKWNFEKMSLVDLVKSCVERMRIEVDARRQTIECYVLNEIPEIEGDYGRLEQVAFNIIGNAVKYTPEGGNITVYVGRIYNDVYFKVTDSGIGIPEEDIERIFERFYRVDKARSREMGGTGLGLSIAREIIEAHKGSINISSKVGVGTEVTVRLPVRQTSQ
ncbi:MAG: cell wall metabolism sensor histidine kinase WalK [Clostridiaceae bacterium]|nr:cell wall metabolism sensor histidine kinase WalK [Clostridiaceae bacterium]